MVSVEQETLAHAKKLYRQSSFPEAELLFRSVMQSGAPNAARAEAAAGAGLILVQKGDFIGAEQMFNSSVKIGGSADAHYGLGIIAEKRADGTAVDHYQAALKINAYHTAARGRLASLTGLGIPPLPPVMIVPPDPPHVEGDMPNVEPKPPPAPRPTLPGELASFYELLGNDRAPASASMSQLAIQLIDAMATDGTPRLSAYPLSIFFLIVGVVPIVIFVGYLLGSVGSLPGVVSFIGVVIWVVALGRIATARRTRYVLKSGWLVVYTGVFFTAKKNHELTHLTEVEVTRGPLDLLTGNGKLHLTFDKSGKVILHAVAPIEKLEVLSGQLLDVSRLLRANPLLKGIVV